MYVRSDSVKSNVNFSGGEEDDFEHAGSVFSYPEKWRWRSINEHKVMNCFLQDLIFITRFVNVNYCRVQLFKV